MGDLWWDTKGQKSCRHEIIEIGGKVQEKTSIDGDGRVLTVRGKFQPDLQPI